MNQYLIDYTIRNITTGDEEDIRILELAEDEFDGFPAEIRDEVRRQVEPAAEAFAAMQLDYHAWDRAQMRILELLRPYMTDEALYERDYDAWEANLLESVH
jgi:hypothetical protein